jgi:hypothetical protein
VYCLNKKRCFSYVLWHEVTNSCDKTDSWFICFAVLSEKYFVFWIFTHTVGYKICFCIYFMTLTNTYLFYVISPIIYNLPFFVKFSVTAMRAHWNACKDVTAKNRAYNDTAFFYSKLLKISRTWHMLLWTTFIKNESISETLVLLRYLLRIQSVLRLATGWTFLGSNPSGVKFSPSDRL